jgi:CheY-like chemotaxis protein
MKEILVIDDQPCVRELIAEELTDEGYQVNGVVDAEEVGKHLKTSQPDLVLLDLYLKGFEGWDVLRTIKNRQPHVPVIIFTAYDSFSKDPRSALADGYLIKSFNAFDKLKEKIAMLLHTAS